MVLSATFSVDAGVPARICVTNGSGEDVAWSHPEIEAEPLEALEDMGFRLIYPSQDLLFGPTMGATGYQKVHVVPLNNSQHGD